MRFDEFIARPALVTHLRGAFGSGRFYHAYLFSGPAGSGRRTMARICARALFCTAGEGQKPCGVCAGCLSVEEDGMTLRHPDILYLQPQDDKQSIGIDDVRELCDRLSDRPFLGGARAVLVDQADAMTVQAQNALLKTLEEPPEGTVFFLRTETQSPLLTTIRSRCQTVRFTPVETERIEQGLLRMGMNAETAKERAKYSEGLFGRAAAEPDENEETLRRETRAALQAAMKGQAPASAAGAIRSFRRKDKPEKDEQALILGCVETAAREKVRKGEGSGARLLETVLETKKMLKQNVTWQYALEWLLMRAAEENK